VSRCIKEKFCRNKKIQRHWRLVAYEENNDAGGKDTENDESCEYRGIEGGVPKEGDRLPSFLVRRK
jgi:hypothetical protein